jgi:RNA polymerase sigma factor for flagellar operon FliA
MVDLIRRHVPLSRGAVERRRLMREKTQELTGKLGREPYDTELASALGMTLGDLEALRNASEPLRFEAIDDAYSDSNMAFADDTPDSLSSWPTRNCAAASRAPSRNCPNGCNW